MQWLKQNLPTNVRASFKLKRFENGSQNTKFHELKMSNNETVATRILIKIFASTKKLEISKVAIFITGLSGHITGMKTENGVSWLAHYKYGLVIILIVRSRPWRHACDYGLNSSFYQFYMFLSRFAFHEVTAYEYSDILSASSLSLDEKSL